MQCAAVLQSMNLVYSVLPESIVSNVGRDGAILPQVCIVALPSRHPEPSVAGRLWTPCTVLTRVLGEASPLLHLVETGKMRMRLQHQAQQCSAKRLSQALQRMLELSHTLCVKHLL